MGSYKFSNKGENSLKVAEGFRAKPYRDSAGHCTVGYGHKVKKGEAFTELTEYEAENLMRQDVAPIVRFLNIHLDTLVTQNQFDALVMFIFNIGETRFLGSSVFENLKNRKYDEATAPWSKWINITIETVCEETGEKIKKLVPCDGLINRRAREIQLFNA
jgi:lysozyme